MDHICRVSQCLAVGVCLWGGWGCNRRSPSNSVPADVKTATAAQANSPQTTAQVAEQNAEIRIDHNSADSIVKATSTTPTENASESMKAATAESSRESVPEAVWIPSGSWTTQRLVALAETGPVVIDMSLNVGNLSLREANDRILARTAAELLAATEPSISWEQLLELPLVQSGWLGNLVAPPEQTGPLIDQYDNDRDAQVSAQELKMFLSRGLERSAALQVSDIGEAPDRQPNASPWGTGDRNQDHVLDANERDQFAEALGNRDLNADGLITAAEWAEPNGDAAQMGMMNGQNRNRFLRNQTLLLLDTPEVNSRSEDASAASDRMTRDAAQVNLH
ncbi:MAG: hypothetical protein ABI557_19505, partial [Aureliella sp.]